MEERRHKRGKIEVTGRQIESSESFWEIPKQGTIRMARTTGGEPLTSEMLSRLDYQDEQLLPGLFNEIVLEKIVTKLPWTAFYTLSSVSRSWLQTIRNRQVFDARVRSCTTETLLVLDSSQSCHSKYFGVPAIYLYSTMSKTWHALPNFPNERSQRGIPNGCRCVSLHGKLYILGGKSEKNPRMESREVSVFDLVGQTGWRQCANMLKPRKSFAAGVINGKIYVAGGISGERLSQTAEVYDPEENVWSSIRPIVSTNSALLFMTIGEELWLYPGEGLGYKMRDTSFAEVYRPAKDEWEMVQPFNLRHPQVLFAARGRVYGMRFNGIYVMDCNDNQDSMTLLYTFLHARVEDRGSGFISPIAAYAVDDEIFALVHWITDGKHSLVLLQSTGFGNKSDKMVWEKVHSPFVDQHKLRGCSWRRSGTEPFMLSVQL